jgi:TP901 family phage tail tape measure protein
MPVVDDLVWQIVFKGWDKWGDSVVKTSGNLNTIDKQVVHTQQVIDKIGKKNLTLGSAGAIREAELLSKKIQDVQTRYSAYQTMMEQRSAAGLSLRGYATQFTKLGQELEKTKSQFASARLQLPKTNLDAYVGQIEHYKQSIVLLKQEMSNLSKQKTALSPTWDADIRKKADEIKQLQYAIKQMPAFPSAKFQGGQTLLSVDQIRKFEFLNAQLKAAESHFTTIGMQARRISSDIGSVASQWGIAFAVVAGSMAAAGIKAGGFEKKMAEVNSITHYSSQEFAKAKREVLDLYGDVPTKSLDDFAGGLYNIRSSGVEAADSIRVLGLSAKAAAAGQTDLDIASKAGLSTIHAFNLPMSRLNEVLDYQFKLVDKGIGRYKDFQPVLSRVQSAARLAGQSIGSTYAVLAQLTRQGMSPRLAAMAETRLLTSMVSQRARIKKFTGIDTVDAQTGRMKDVVVFLNEIQKKTKDGTITAQNLTKAFAQTNALQAVTLLTGAIGNMNKMAKDFDWSAVAGSMVDAYGKATDNIQDQMKLAKQKFEVMMVDIGNSPAIKASFKTLIKTMSGVSDFFKTNQLSGVVSWGGVITAAATGGAFALMKIISVAARGVGAFYSLRGAVASVGLLELSRNMQTATATFEGMGMAMTEATGAASLLRAAFIGLQVAAVLATAVAGYAIGTWIDKQINGAIYAQNKLGAESLKLAQDFRVVGGAAIEGTNAFRQKNEILKKLNGNFPDLVAKLKSGKISMDEFADSVQNAANKMANMRTVGEELVDSTFYGGKGGLPATPEYQNPEQGQGIKDQLKALIQMRDKLDKGQKATWRDFVLAVPNGSPMARGTGFMGTGPSGVNDMQKALGNPGFNTVLNKDALNKQILASRRQAMSFWGEGTDKQFTRGELGASYGKMAYKPGDNTVKVFKRQVDELTSAGLDQSTARLAQAAKTVATNPGAYKQMFGEAALTVAGDMCARGGDALAEAALGFKIPGANAQDIFNKAANAAAGNAEGVTRGGEASPGSIVVTRRKDGASPNDYHFATMDTSGKFVETSGKAGKQGVGYRGKGRDLQSLTDNWAREYFVINGPKTYAKLMKGTLYKPSDTGLQQGSLQAEKVSGQQRLDHLINDLQNQIRKAETDAKVASLRAPESGYDIRVRSIKAESEAKKIDARRTAGDQLKSLNDQITTELASVKGGEASKLKIKALYGQLTTAINRKTAEEIARIDRDTQRKIEMQLAQDALDRLKYSNQLSVNYRKSQSEYLSITSTSARDDLAIIKSEYFDKIASIQESYQQAKMDRNKQISEGLLPEGDMSSWNKINDTYNQDTVNAGLDAQKKLKQGFLNLYDTEMSGYSDLRTANFNLYRDITTAADGSFSTRISLIQQETDIQLRELGEQRDAYLRNADLQKKTATERANDLAKLDAQQKDILVKNAVQQREAAMQQVESALALGEKLYGASNRAAFTQKPSDTLSGVNDVTPKATQNLMEFAKIYDSLLAKAGASPEERADKFLGYLSTAIEKDKQRLNFYMDMLDLPRQKVIEIRKQFIRDGLFLGDEVIQAEQDNLKELIQPFIDFQDTVKSGWSDAFKGVITGEDDAVAFGKKISDAYKKAVADYVTNEIVMPFLNPVFQTPEQKAIEEQTVKELANLNYRKDIQTLEDLAVQAFKDGITVFQQSVDKFAAAANLPIVNGLAPVLPTASDLALPTTGEPIAPTTATPAANSSTPLPWETWMQNSQPKLPWEEPWAAGGGGNNQAGPLATLSGDLSASGVTITVAADTMLTAAEKLDTAIGAASGAGPKDTGSPIVMAAAVAAGLGLATKAAHLPGGTTVGAAGATSTVNGLPITVAGAATAGGPAKMSKTDSIAYGVGAVGAVAGQAWMGKLAQIAATPGGLKGAWGAKANGLGNIMTGAGGFMSGYSTSAATGKMDYGNVAMSGLTGFATGGPIGGLIGVGSSLLGGMFGKGKHKSEPPPPKEIQQMQGPEDIQWATKNYIRRAAEGGREGLPLSLGTRSNQANINSNVNVNFARIEIVSADPRSAGADFVAGVSEGPAKVLANQISSSPSSR